MVNHFKQNIMKNNPIFCECPSCECAIYTFEDSAVCKACTDGNHLSGAKKKDYSKSEKETPSSA